MATIMMSKCWASYEPRPNPLPEPWAKPHVRKAGDSWVCSVQGFMHHGDAVIIRGRHQDLKWAWIIMVDHLVRHDIKPTYQETQ